MACDVCGAKGTSLNNIREQFATDDVRAVCPNCERVINSHLSKLDGMWVRMRSALLKRFMSERAHAKEGQSHE